MIRGFQLRGIIPAMVTPFAANGQVSEDQLRREAEFLTKAGVDGLCVGGTISETAGASASELHRICAAVISSTDRPVIAGIFPDCNVEAYELADACVSTRGIQALLVAPPHYLFSPEADGMAEMFRTLRTRISVPILLSNSILTAPVDLATIASLISAQLIDGVHQVGNAHLLADILNLTHRVPVFSGVEDLLYMAFLLGAEGVISAHATVFPSECVALYRAHLQQDFASARTIHEDLNRRWRVLDHPVEFLSRIKAVLDLQSRPVGSARSPYHLISAEGQRSVRQLCQRS